MRDFTISGKMKFAPGFLAGLTATAVANARANLVQAANEAMLYAQERAHRFDLTGHAARNIHVVPPGMMDPGTGEVESSGLSAGPDEALVIGKTHRKYSTPVGGTGKEERDMGDYFWYQEMGPAARNAPMGRHHLGLAAESIRGMYPGVEVGAVQSVAERGGR